MKRFLVFTGEAYYPKAAWNDFKEDFDSLSEAEATVDPLLEIGVIDWYQIVDTETKKTVSIGGSAHGGLRL